MIKTKNTKWSRYNHVIMTPGDLDFEKIRLILNDKHYPPKQLKSPILKHSAVLILLVNHSDSYSIILTERTRNMKHHSGEISFPGGRHDPDIDVSLKDTALRECEEEIGISRNKIEILGQLDDVPTMTGYIITPVVGKIDIENPIFTRNKVEVEQIFTIPIDFFLNPAVFREQSMDYGNDKFPIFMFDYRYKSKRYTIWGATAHILVDYLKKVHHYNPSRLPYTRYSKERIEKLVYERKMKSDDKEKEKKIQGILDPKGKVNDES